MSICNFLFAFLAIMLVLAIVNELHHQKRVRARNKRLGERLNELNEGRRS